MILPARLIAALLATVLTVLLAGVALTSARALDAEPDAAPGARESNARSERSVRASGLAWHSGVFSHDAQQTTQFAQARGRPVDVLAVFPTRDSWATILQDWWMSPTAVPEGFTGTLAVGVPLFPGDGSLAAAASGADDARWEELGRLIASRYPDAWVRPGWEMNIPNWPWAATPENVSEYKAAFRRAATALRRGGPGLRIVFNPNEGRGASLPDARLAYPGDDVVDVIGIDAYDWYPAYDSGGWEEHRTKDQGWDFWANFARARGKKFAVPEWGVMTGSDASGGDNPTYIRSVLEWMGDNADIMAFDAYFEETQDYCRCALSLNPKAAAEYAAVLPQVAERAPCDRRQGCRRRRGSPPPRCRRDRSPRRMPRPWVTRRSTSRTWTCRTRTMRTRVMRRRRGLRGRPTSRHPRRRRSERQRLSRPPPRRRHRQATTAEPKLTWLTGQRRPTSTLPHLPRRRRAARAVGSTAARSPRGWWAGHESERTPPERCRVSVVAQGESTASAVGAAGAVGGGGDAIAARRAAEPSRAVPGEVDEHAVTVRRLADAQAVGLLRAQDVDERHRRLGGDADRHWLIRLGRVQMPAPVVVPDDLGKGAGIAQEGVDRLDELLVVEVEVAAQSRPQRLHLRQLRVVAVVAAGEGPGAQEVGELVGRRELIGVTCGVDEGRHGLQGHLRVMGEGHLDSSLRERLAS